MTPPVTTLTFLGTGGGHAGMVGQGRATGGLYLEDGASRLHLDPGPGAIVQMHRAELDPTDTTGVLVTHNHLDHCNDASLAVEGMSQGRTKQRGYLVGAESVLEGTDDRPPVVPRSHRDLALHHETARPGHTSRVSGLRVSYLATDHDDPTSIGFRIDTRAGVVTYYTDTRPRQDLLTQLEDTRVLVLGVPCPRGSRVPGHLNTEDAQTIARRVDPELLVLTHLGPELLKAGPDREASRIQEATGVPTVAARDLTRIRADHDLRVCHPGQAPGTAG